MQRGVAPFAFFCSAASILVSYSRKQARVCASRDHPALWTSEQLQTALLMVTLICALSSLRAGA